MVFNFYICTLYKDDGVIENCICLHLDKLRSLFALG